MRSLNFVRTAVLAASLATFVSSIVPAFANDANSQQAPQQQTMQQMQQPSNSGPYDSPDFVLPPSEIYS